MNATILTIGLFALYTIVSAFGLFMLKTSNGILSLGFAAGLALYGVGFLVWYGMLLTRMPLSVAFPIAAGSVVAATQVVGYLFLGETLRPGHLGGIALILAGIALVFVEA